jgi:nitrogen-specific signal transduction histidine kinase
VRLLANPILVRMALALIASITAFGFGILAVRVLRRKLVEEDGLSDNLGGDDAQYAYSAVIQQLKQQKFELQNEQNTQRRRAKTSEHITAAVIANLPCGVLLVGSNGLVRQANAAARQLLGFASPLGMSPEELFRDTAAISQSGESLRFADAMRDSLREQFRGTFTAHYETANAEQRNFSLTVIPLTLPPDEILGMACVIADDSAAARLRQEKLLHGELSAEMALELRTSLSMIRDYADKVSAAADQSATAHLAEDIVHQTERLDKVVGGFLAGGVQERTLAAKA